MARVVRSPLDRQVRHVRRRLIFEALLQRLLWSSAGALLCTAVWFLFLPHLFANAEPWLRWAVPAGFLFAGMAIALGLTWVRRPSPLLAALALDERFGLRERVTTSITLSPQQRSTGVGEALLADTNERVANLDIGERFPVRVSWQAVAAPLAACALAVAGFFYQPAAGQADEGNPEANPLAASKAREDEDLKKAMQNLQPRADRGNAVKDEGPGPLDADDEQMGKITRRPHETEAERKARAAELSQLEMELKRKQEQLAAQADAVREELKNNPEHAAQQPKDGPAKKLEDALTRGDSQKAKEEVDRLSQALEKDKLSPQEKQQLQEQLRDLQQQLQKDAEQLGQKNDEQKILKDLGDQGKLKPDALQRELDALQKQGQPTTDPKQLADKLKDLAEKGELDPQAARQALEELRKNAGAQKELQDAAQQLAQCEKCMQEGDSQKAGDSLRKAGDKLDGQESRQQQDQLSDKTERVAQAKQAMLRASQGGPGQPGAGKRPEEKDDRFGTEKVQAETNADAKGYHEIAGDGPRGGQRKPRTPAEVAEDVQQRSQQAPAALRVNPHLARDNADMTRGYFENLGGQKTPR